MTHTRSVSFSSATGGYYSPSGTWKPRHIGILKSYNNRNGFGFIQCKETHVLHKQDVFIHKSHVPEYVQIGQWVEFVVTMSAKGQPQASNVSWLAQKSGPNGEAIEISAVETPNRYAGTLKSFSTKSGYGFVACADLKQETQRDVYIHKAELPSDGEWRIGQELEFQVFRNAADQLQARNVVWK